MSNGQPVSMSALLAPPAQPELSVLTEQPSRQVQFLTTNVTPPSDLYIGPDDSIRVELFAQNAGILVHIKMRFVSAAGEMMYEEEQLNTLALPTIASQDYRMGEGFLLSVALSADSAINARGRVFGSVSYIRAFGSSQSSYMHTLVQGYVAATQRVSWPIIQTDSAVNGQGLPVWVSFANPAAGANFTYTCPNNIRTRLMAMSFGLVTSATVGNRYAVFEVALGGSVFVRTAPNVAQAANVSANYYCAHGYTPGQVEPGVFNAPFPFNLLMQAGVQISMGADSLLSTDQVTAPALALEQWVDM